jgi:hypothetical protein
MAKTECREARIKVVLQKPNRIAIPPTVLEGLEIVPGQEFFVILQNPMAKEKSGA